MFATIVSSLERKNAHITGMGTFGIPLGLERKSFELNSFIASKLDTKLQCICSSKFRRTKALASTGFRNEIDAASWLMLHSNDPAIDENCPREFCLFLCAGPSLSAKVYEFWEQQHAHDSWNNAHECPPHITLISGLRIPDDRVLLAHEILDRVIYDMRNVLPFTSIPLKRHSLHGFIGYLVASEAVNMVLNEICDKLLTEFSVAGIKLDEFLPKKRKTTFHMSVAYGFSSVCAGNLSNLQETVLPAEIDDPLISWTLDLFSYDARLSIPNSELYEMQTTVEVDDTLFTRLSQRVSHSNECPEVAVSPAIPCPVGGDHSSSSGNDLTPESSSDSQPSDVLLRTDRGRPSFTVPSRSFSMDSNCPYSTILMPSGVSTCCPPAFAQCVLPHSFGDFVLLTGADDFLGYLGSPIGLNLNTGLWGAFNAQAGLRVPKCNAWVLHRSVSVSGNAENDGNHNNILIAPSLVPNFSNNPMEIENCPLFDESSNGTGEFDRTSPTVAVSRKFRNTHSTSLLLPFCRSKQQHQGEDGKSTGQRNRCKEAVCNLQAATSSPTIFGSLFSGILGNRSCAGRLRSAAGRLQQSTSIEQRRLFIMRHSERVDMCFGRGWTAHCIDKRGLYRRQNLNMPPRLHTRADLLDHVLDSPLTQVGLFIAASSGRALAEAGVRFSVCYASPALRCVQTACQLLQASGHSHLKVRIEPLLFEWLGWYTGQLPNFLSQPVLHQLGYTVDTTYTPISSVSALDPHENVGHFYERSSHLINRILERHTSKNSSVLIVAHAASLDSCTRSLLRKRFRSGGVGGVSSSGVGEVEELNRRSASVPYCGLLMLVEGRRWHLQEPPIPCLSYKENTDFDWRQFHGPLIRGSFGGLIK